MAEEFHLGIGGPLHRLEHAAHLSLGRLIFAAIAISWLPLLVLALAQRGLTGRGEPMLADPSVHLRFVVAIPLFLLAERLLDRACHTAIGQLFSQGFVPREQLGRVRAMLHTVGRWRDSPLPESVILVGAIGIGVGVWLGLLHQPGVAHFEARTSVVGAWYALVSLPLFQFLLWRSLFRWALWARVLGGLSRVPLRLLPTHVDRRGGLSFLKRPSVGYCALLLLAVSSVLCGEWTAEVTRHGARLEAFKPLFLVFVLVGSLVALGPLLAFVPRLFLARLKGSIQYGALASDYSSRFEEHWFAPAPRAELLGSPEIQSLADLGGAYRENVEKMQLLLFSPRDLVLLLVAALLPAIPLVLSQVPARQVLMRLVHLFSGGVPG